MSLAPFRSLIENADPAHLITGYPLLSLMVKSSWSLVIDVPPLKYDAGTTTYSTERECMLAKGQYSWLFG
jgi:hypothetical protein